MRTENLVNNFVDNVSVGDRLHITLPRRALNNTVNNFVNEMSFS